MGRQPHSRSNSGRQLIPWAAIGFSLLWGGTIGVALSHGDDRLALFSAVGMVLTIVLTALLYREQSELRNLAETDPLTGLTNHRGFQQALREKIGNAAAAGGPVALVMLDLDDFKAINEQHGHPFGDGVLHGVGAAIRSRVRAGDIAARTGGEEFALILPGTDEAAAQEIA